MKLTPYREVAKKALINWNGMSEQDATNAVLTQSYEELENQCWATSSMTAAVEGIAKILGLEDNRKEDFLNCVLAKDHAEPNEFDKLVFANIQKKWKQTVEKNSEAIVQLLSDIHDDWVKNNAKKFNKEGRENKRYQHLPLELIGFKEAKLDLLFVETILDVIGVDVNMNQLENAYYKIVANFLNNNNLNSKNDLENYVLNIRDHYSAVTEINSTQDENIASQMVDQVVDKMPQKTKTHIQTEDK